MVDLQYGTPVAIVETVNAAGGDSDTLDEINQLMTAGMPVSENRTISPVYAVAWLLATDSDRSPLNGTDQTPTD